MHLVSDPVASLQSELRNCILCSSDAVVAGRKE